MAVRHLTDDEIQAYLEKGTSALDHVFDSHLNECAACRTRTEEYRRLIGTLEEDRGFILSPGFADAVTTRILAEQAALAKRRLNNLLMTVGGAIGVAGAAAYFMDLQMLWEQIKGVFAPSLQQSAQALTEAQQKVAADGGGTVVVILFCLLVLAAVAGADHLLFRSRQAKFCL